jgi:4-carboxymuconolactone decarboxylase
MTFHSNPELKKIADETYEKLYAGSLADEMQGEYKEKSSDFQSMTYEWCIGGLFGRPGLDLRAREFVAFTCCVADARVQYAVLAHAQALVKLGVKKREIYEAVLLCTWYTGAAPVSMALSTLKDFFAEDDGSMGDA